MSGNSSTNQEDLPKPVDMKREVSWPSVLFFIHLQIFGLYGIFVLFTQTRLVTVLFSKFQYFKLEYLHKKFLYESKAFVLTLMGIYGTTCGNHRLFCHRTYKANSLLRFLLMICQTMAGQVS